MKKNIIFLLFFILILILFVIGFNVYNKSIEKQELINPVVITMITDDDYVLPTRTVIKSIAANKKRNTQVLINVICVNINYNNIQKLQKETKKNLKVNVITLPLRHLQQLPGSEKMQNNIVSRADNAKFFLPKILKNTDKTIYLDGDTIVLKDLTEMFNTDLGNNYIAAADDWQSSWEKPTKDRYFNNGVLLLNLKQMRKDNISPKLVQAKKNDKVKRFITQDAYNTVMKNHIVYLPLTYNTFAPEYDNPNVIERIKETLKDNYNQQNYPYKNEEEYRKNVSVIHYCGWNNIKPWWKLDFSRPANKKWYKYAPLDFWIDCGLGKCKIPYETN